MGEDNIPKLSLPLEIEEIIISSNPKTEMTVDEVIENYVGSLGYSQIIQAILVSLAWMFDAQITLVTIFSDANPKKWRCKPNYTCHNTHESSVCGLKPGTWEWIDGHKSSIIAEWGLVCHHNFLAALPASCFFFGSLLGAAAYGRLADSFLGRKRTLILASLLTAITAFLTSFSINIWTYAICRFLNGLTRSGIGICCLVLATEVVGRKWRGQIGQYGFFFFTLGFISLPLIAFYTKSSWRLLYQILSLLVFLYSIFILPFVAESPRWLLIRGRKNEALLGLSNLATRNGRSLPANIELTDPSLIANDDKKMMSLWGCKWARVRMGKAMIAAFGVGFVYYAVQLNVENLNFNKYVSVAINALIEIPAVFGGSFLLGFMKRRLLFFLSCLFTGISCFLCIIFTKSGKDNIVGNWIQLGIEGIGFMAASLAFDLMFIYCVELFPTNVRNFAVSLMRQALVLGAAVSPLLVVVGRLSPAFSFLVIGVLSILSGLMSICLPETKNLPLFETLEQQEKQENLAHPHHASSNHSST
ncbi:organic cation/carnitine transporter 1 isoform X2 [Amaranthus tricolor]|uniref:organic cation/carnitine transporter 1 isoform X2 n=1 Tax=Amaranthus tricolor TaxID=29722 RepID=UPI002588054F|nr:organic cation/carnitine transporter 1 isoform X2 [Amaranthus tricolor]